MIFGVTVNFVAILVVAVVNFFIGFLWYGPLFGKAWMGAMKLTAKDIQKGKEKGMGGRMFVAFIMSLITTLVLAIFVSWANPDSFIDGVFVGIWVWLGFFLTASIGGMLWEGKSANLLYINTAYDLVRFIIMSGILVLW